MNFLGIATDYDGTLAYQGMVRESTIKALEAARESGRKLILVTGRVLEELLRVFPRTDLFEWVVVENGALLYCPGTRESQLLAPGVPAEFPEEMRRRGITQVEVGRSVVATWRPNECAVLETVRDLGLDRQIIFNKDAVMVLPTGVNKASGLTSALEEMKISRHNVVAIGDAENDLPMLALCECGVAVDNALDSVKKRADVVMKADHGAGVEELIGELLKDDLASRFFAVARRGLLLGTAKEEPRSKVWLPSLGQSVLMAGPSGSGKSTTITGLLERMAKAQYQFCLFDPEGDYERFEPAVNLGNPHYVPSGEEVLWLMERMYSMVVNLLGVSLDERPKVVSEQIRKLEDLRSDKGLPHWFVLDEAHHIFPANELTENTLLHAPPKTSLMITVHPEHVGKEALETVDIVMAVGKEPEETIRRFCKAVGAQEPVLKKTVLERGEVLVWFRHQPGKPYVVVAEPGLTEHKRHVRKYAEGDLGLGSFVFRGPDGRLNLVAQNLNTFMRMAEGVDDETWNYHLHNGNLSEWFRWIVKNEDLAECVRELESNGRSAQETRQAVVEAIQERYTMPE